MKASFVVLAALLAAPALATLPPSPEAAKAQAKETAAKSAWNDKVAAYKLCLSMDRTADAYRRARKDVGEAVPAPVQAPPCVDPGPYVAPDQAAQPQGGSKQQ